MQPEEIRNRFKEFVLSIKHKKTAIIHDSDADGICSGVITAKAIERITGKKPVLFHQNPGEIGLTENTLNELRSSFTECIISVDLSIDQQKESVKEAEEFAVILVLDHHKTYNEINSERTLMIKSQDLTGKEGSSYPVSKLSIDLFSGLTDLSDLDWVSSIGLLGDNAYAEWKDFVDGVMEKYSLGENPKKSVLFTATSMIESIEVMDYSKLKDVLNVFLNARKPEDVLKKDLLNEMTELEKEISFWENEFKEKKEVFPEKELIYFELKPVHSIKSALINRVSENQRNKTIVLVQDFNEEHVYFSARRQDHKVKVNDLLEKSIKGIPDSLAGGHAPAAAGKIPRKYLKKFRENLIRNAYNKK